MADDREDRYAFIIDNCLYSYSQEDLLISSFFAREDQTSPADVAVKSPPPLDHQRINLSDSIAGNENDFGDLGFRGERKESLTKFSPLMNCSGKVVIGSELNGSEVIFEGDLKVKLIRPLRGVAIDSGVECSDGKLGFEGSEDDFIENRTKKKLKFGVDEENAMNVVDTEVIEVAGNESVPCVDTEVLEAVEEGGTGFGAKVDGNCDLDEGIVEFDEALESFEKRNVGVEEVVVGQGEGKFDGETSNVGNEENVVNDNVLQEGEEVTGRKKRKLPRSMFEQWGEAVGNGNDKSDDCESSIRCILDAIKFLVRDRSCGDDSGEVDFLETAKRRGMTFPRPRYRSASDGGA